jgi:hypothetical protein
VGPADSLRDPYNLLADALLHGRTWLDVPFDRRILSLPDPYDPAQRARYPSPQLLDLSLYHGQIYPYWGPSPAVVAFVPFRALGLGDLPPGLAALAFALVGLVCSSLLLLALLRALLPRAPGWLGPAGVVALATANVAPFVLRRAEAYEVAITAAFAFSYAGLLALLRGAPRAPASVWRLALGSLLLGLAFAARPPMGLAVAFAAGVLVWLVRSGRAGARRDRVRAAAALLAPFLACVALVGAYNAVRFDSPTQFGQTYQLAGQKQDKFLRAQYVPPGLWYYLLVPPRPRAKFPYLWLNLVPSVPWPTPRAYDAAERTGGLLPDAPILLVLLVAPLALRRAPPRLRAAVAAAAAFGAVLLVFLAAYYWGGIQRYELDFATALLIAAILTWAALVAGRRGAARRAIAVGGCVLIAWGALVGLALSLVGSDDRLRLLHPGTYASLERFFAPIPTAAASIAGHPILASVGGDPLVGPERYDRLGVAGASFWLGLDPVDVEVVSSRAGPAALTARVSRGPTTPRGTGRLLLQATGADGRNAAAPIRGGEVALAVVLRRGINHVPLVVLAQRPTGIEGPGAATGGGVRVEGLGVHALRS